MSNQIKQACSNCGWIGTRADKKRREDSLYSATYVCPVCECERFYMLADLENNECNKDNTFPMFDNWKPDIEISESVLKEFIFFWTGKPDIKKTNEQWLQALAQSQQYADSRNEYYCTKGDHYAE